MPSSVFYPPPPPKVRVFSKKTRVTAPASGSRLTAPATAASETASFRKSEKARERFIKSPAAALSKTPPLGGKRRRESGFSLTGVLVASSIGLIVLSGTTEMMLQLSSKISQQEKKAKRPLLQSYLTDYLGQGAACQNTLQDLKLKTQGTTLAAAAAKSDEIFVLKNKHGKDLIDFTSPSGKLRLKNEFGVDQFDRLVFTNFQPDDGVLDFSGRDTSLSPSDVETGRAQLIFQSRSFLQRKIPQYNPNFALNLTGVQVQKDGHGSGKHKINACSANLDIAFNCIKLDASKEQSLVGCGSTTKNPQEMTTAFGFNAGSSQNTGAENTFIGYKAGEKNTSGKRNTFVGHNAGAALTTGIANVFIGRNSGASVTSGTRNIFLKGRADAAGLSVSGNHQLNIGHLIFGRMPAPSDKKPTPVIPADGSPGVVIHGSLNVSGALMGNGVDLSNLQQQVTNLSSELRTLTLAHDQLEQMAIRINKDTWDYATAHIHEQVQHLVRLMKKDRDYLVGLIQARAPWPHGSHGCTVCPSSDSSRVYKKNIQPFKDFEKALNHILTVPLFTYQFKAKGNHPRKTRMGLIAEDLPESLQLPGKRPDNQKSEGQKPRKKFWTRESAKQRQSESGRRIKESVAAGSKEPSRQDAKSASQENPPKPDWPSVYGTLWAGIKALAARQTALKTSLKKETKEKFQTLEKRLAESEKQRQTETKALKQEIQRLTAALKVLQQNPHNPSDK